jgi:hypothetical protein
MNKEASGEHSREGFQSGVAITLRLVMIVCPLALLVFLIWTRNRGFDITDEGYSLLAAKSPRTILAAASFGYMYLAQVFHLVGDNIVALRVCGYIFTVLSACALWAGMRAIVGITTTRTDKNKILDDVAGLALIITGSLLIYVWFHVTPSYNLMNSAGAGLFGGGMLAGLAHASSGRQRLACALFLATGFALGFCVFVKFPTGLLLAFLAIVGIAFWPLQKWRIKAVLVSSLAGGIVLWCMFHFFFFLPPQETYLIFHRGLDIAYRLDAGHTASSVISRTLTDTWQLIRDMLGKYGWLCAAGITCGIALKIVDFLRGKRAANLVYILPAMALIILILVFKNAWFWGGTRGINHVCSTLLGFIVIGLLWIAGKIFEEHKSGVKIIHPYSVARGLVILFLIALPLLEAEGTNNYLYVNMVFGMGAWAAALWIMFCASAITPHAAWARLTIPAVFATLITLMILSGSLYYPYRLVRPLSAQVVPTNIGNPATTLRMDVPTSAFFAALNRAGRDCGIGPKSYVLGFYDVPGIVFALGARSPGVPWYTGGYPGTLDVATRIVSWIPGGVLREAFVITTDSGSVPELQDQGAEFPQGFHLCSEIESPYGAKPLLKIWKPD